jgi:hypothetical protein
MLRFVAEERAVADGVHDAASVLEGPLVVQRLEDPRPGAEPAGHGALAQSRPSRQPVHGQPVRALFGEHLAG